MNNYEISLLKAIAEADISDSASSNTIFDTSKPVFNENEYSDDVRGSYKYFINENSIREKECTYKDYKEVRMENPNIGEFQPNGIELEYSQEEEYSVGFEM